MKVTYFSKRLCQRAEQAVLDEVEWAHFFVKATLILTRVHGVLDHLAQIVCANSEEHVH